MQKKVLVALIVSLFATGCGGGGEQSFSSPSPQYQSLHIAPMMANVRTGTTISFSGVANRFIAVGIRADGNGEFNWDLRTPVSGVTWNSSNPAVASIDSRGHFNAVSAGTTTISATLGTLTASTTLVVSDSAPILTAVEMYPGLPKFGASGIIGIQFQAIAAYDDGSTRDITREGVWISTDTSAATVDSSGMITYRSTSECDIMFLYGLSYNSFRLKRL